MRAVTDGRNPADFARRSRRRLASASGLGLWLQCVGATAHAQDAAVPQPNAAAEQSCAAGRVQIAGSISARWFANVARLCAELPTMKDADASARLRIAPDGDAVVLSVVLGDGRATSRRVRTPDELPLSVEALIAIPSTQATPANDVSPQVPAAEATPTAADKPAAPQPTPIAAPAERSLSIELGALATGRVARAPTYLSLGVAGYAGLRVRDWLLGLTLRWDPFQALIGATAPKDLDMESVGAGFFLARNVLASRSIGLDVGANALLLAEMQNFRGPKTEHEAVESDVRLGVFSRLSLGQSPWRWAVSIDAEVSPLRLRRARRLDALAPTLPTWSLGLGLGACWRDL
jgi:hypothetical protein